MAGAVSFSLIVSEALMPALSQVSGGLAGPPQKRSTEIANLDTASVHCGWIPGRRRTPVGRWQAGAHKR